GSEDLAVRVDADGMSDGITVVKRSEDFAVGTKGSIERAGGSQADDAKITRRSLGGSSGGHNLSIALDHDRTQHVVGLIIDAEDPARKVTGEGGIQQITSIDDLDGLSIEIFKIFIGIFVAHFRKAILLNAHPDGRHRAYRPNKNNKKEPRDEVRFEKGG